MIRPSFMLCECAVNVWRRHQIRACILNAYWGDALQHRTLDKNTSNGEILMQHYIYIYSLNRDTNCVSGPNVM